MTQREREADLARAARAGNNSRLASPGVAALLALLIVASLLTNLGVRNPDPDLVPYYAPLVGFPMGDDVGFVTARPWRQGLYSYHALRYVLAPRVVEMQGREPRSAWIVSDGAGPYPGFDTVQRFEGGLQILRRR